MSGVCPHLTGSNGAPIGDFENCLTVGPRGPLLMQDAELFDQIQMFNRERIPERVVHALGMGAHGVFKVTKDITRYTKASMFSSVGKETPAFVRFSPVSPKQGDADAERDPRGFAMKFFTEEGNWDLVCNNTPIFFVRDPYKFQQFIHSQKRHPKTHLRDPNTVWDFLSLCPESIHQVTWLFGDRGLPFSYRHMNGYGSHTFSMFNKDNERVWVKFHFKSHQGVKGLTNDQAMELMSQDRDSHTRDLYDAIAAGKFPKWTLFIQVMTEEQAHNFRWNPFDLTKVWPHGEFPLLEVGVLELNRNVENYFTEVEQAAFNPAAMVPGIGPSPDRMLQARLLSYQDAHIHRLGANYRQLDINRPKVPVHRYTQEGCLWQLGDKHTGHPNYYPNSVKCSPSPNPKVKNAPELVTRSTTERFSSREGWDDYTQARWLYQLMSPDEKYRLVNSIASSISGCRRDIIERQLKILYQVHEEYGRGVEKALNTDPKGRGGVSWDGENSTKSVKPPGMGVRE